MRIEIEKYFNRIKRDIEDLSSKVSYKNCKLDETDINIDVKHILGDMQSILDYIAVEIYEKYYGQLDGKIYFPYTKDSEKNFIKYVQKNFPDLLERNKDIYEELANVQCFRDSSNWIIILMDLTNEVKHNNLYITKVKKEKNTLLKSDNTSMMIKGDLKIQQMESRYGVFGEGKVYVSGNGRVGFYSDGTIEVGNGTYNVDTKETNKLNTEIYYENCVKSAKYNENIIDLLWLIFNKESRLVSNLESFI